MSLITPFDPWKSKWCSCPQKYSLSAYTGCSHGCLYCYASSYIRNFTHVRPKKDFLLRLEREIKKLKPDSFITIANSSDPYLPLEKELKLTQEALMLLKNYDLRIMIVTKSSLILRDIEILKDFSAEGEISPRSGGKKIVVSISITTLKEALAKKLEPNASLPKERLSAIDLLSKKIPVVCRLDPLIYPLNTKEIKEVVRALRNSGAKQIITSTYKAKTDNFKRMLEAFPEFKELWEKLYLKEGERIARYIYLEQSLRKKLIGEVKEACRKEGLEFSSCREGFDKLNTKNCDGSSFFTA